MKAISVGLLYTDGNSFLGCHSTGNKFYDLPKGAPEPDETPRQTCLRETLEETGLDLDAGSLIDLGIVPYNRQKDLHLFALVAPELPDLDSLTCTSTFLHRYSKKPVPEVDGYRHIPFAEASAFMTANMVQAIEEARRRLKAATGTLL